MKIGIVVVDAFMNLPEIEPICAQPAQRIFQHPHRDPTISAVRADLRHQKDAIAAADESAPHPLFGTAIVVFPGVVEEVDAGVDRFVRDALRLFVGRRRRQRIAAHADDRHLVVVATEAAARYLARPGVRQLRRRLRERLSRRRAGDRGRLAEKLATRASGSFCHPRRPLAAALQSIAVYIEATPPLRRNMSSTSLIFGSSRKRMRDPRLRIVVLDRRLVRLEPAIAGQRPTARAQSGHRIGGHRLKSARDPKIAAQDVEPFHADDRRRHRQAHRITKRLLAGDGAGADRLARAPHRLHAEHRDAAARRLGNHFAFETSEVVIERIERHLHGVEAVAHRQHPHVDRGILVAGEAHEAHLPLLPGPIERFEDAAAGIGQSRVIVEGDAVHLPEIQMIRAQPPQRFVQHLEGKLRVPTMRADLRHQKDAIPLADEGATEPVLAAASPIFPAVVEERDAAVDRLVHEADGILHRWGVAEMMTPQAEGGDAIGRSSELPQRNGVGRSHIFSPV